MLRFRALNVLLKRKLKTIIQKPQAHKTSALKGGKIKENILSHILSAPFAMVGGFCALIRDSHNSQTQIAIAAVPEELDSAMSSHRPTLRQIDRSERAEQLRTKSQRC